MYCPTKLETQHIFMYVPSNGLRTHKLIQGFDKLFQMIAHESIKNCDYRNCPCSVQERNCAWDKTPTQRSRYCI